VPDERGSGSGSRTRRVCIDRVQLGVRLDKRLVQVLKGLAEYKGTTLGQLIEEIVLYSFEPVPGHEGEWCVSPHSQRSLRAVVSLKKVYDMDQPTRTVTADESHGAEATESEESE
jgi:hypothetical protein